MPLKKTCRCGAIIDYNAARCAECEKHKADKNRYYDTSVRKDKDSTTFYHSSEWQRTAKLCKIKNKGIDIYSYYVLGLIEYGNICHHIEPIKTDAGWQHRLDMGGLIYLTNENHALVHAMYDENERKAMETKRMLFDLVNKWKNEMC